MAAVKPDEESVDRFFIGDTKRFRAVGDLKGTFGQTLDGTAWTVSGVTLELYPPGQTDPVVVPGIPASISYADYTIPDSVGGISSIGDWNAYFILTDGTDTETCGPFKFRVRKRGVQ